MSQIKLRPHQVVAVSDVDRLFSLGHQRALCVQPTGSGKTILKAHYAKLDYDARRVCVIFAHRDVLLEQISGACALMGVPHSFICNTKTQRDATNLNLREFGDSYWDELSTVVIISVPTFAARLKNNKIPQMFLNSVHRWLMDETHHLTIGSQWGKCVEAIPQAIGLGFTATPLRGDKKGLGEHADGYFQAMSVTTNMFELIKDGRLTPYKIFATGQIDINGIKKDKDGELNKKQLHIRTKEADITGDAVEQYLKHLEGQPVITFCVNIAHSIEVAQQFNDHGISSVAVSSKTESKERVKAVADLRAGRIMNLVNCDLFGEGFDAPAVAGVIMLRRTTSYSLYKQQFGRMLRPFEGKAYGILLDHVGNTQFMMEAYHLKQPHDDPIWTLDNQQSSKNNGKENCGACGYCGEAEEFESDATSNIVCPECGYEDEIIETMQCSKCSFFGVVGDFTDDETGEIKCPDEDCGHVETDEESETRVRELKVKQGQLVELDNDIINNILQQRELMYKSVPEFASTMSDNFRAKGAAVNNFAVRQTSLNILRHWIQEWSTLRWKTTGSSIKAVQMDFELEFKVNIFKAQTTTEPAMNRLTSHVQKSYREMSL